MKYITALIYSPPQITTADFLSAVPVADYFNSHPITATADADEAVAACLGKAHLTATAEQQQQLYNSDNCTTATSAIHFKLTKIISKVYRKVLNHLKLESATSLQKTGHEKIFYKKLD